MKTIDQTNAFKRVARIIATGFTALALSVSAVALPADLNPTSTVDTAYAASELKAGSLQQNGKTKITSASIHSGPTISSDIYSIQCTYGKRYLDIPKSSQRNARVKTWDSDGWMAQRFVIWHQGDNKYTIQASCSGKYLTDVNGKVYQKKRNYSNSAQKWRIIKYSSYVYYIRNVATGRYLTVDGFYNSSTVSTYGFKNINKQRFHINKRQMIKDHWYRIYNQACFGSRDKDKFSLDVSNASRTNFANVQIWKPNGTSAQQWYVYNVYGNYYRIMCGCSNKYLTRLSNNNVCQKNYVANDSNQLWYAQVNDNGGIRFLCKSTNQALTVSRIGSGWSVYTSYYGGYQTWNFIDL